MRWSVLQEENEAKQMLARKYLIVPKVPKRRSPSSAVSSTEAELGRALGSPKVLP